MLDPAEKETLARAAQSLFGRFLELQLPGYFDQLEGALVLETDRQKNQNAQQPFFDAVALLRRQRPRVLLAVVNRLNQAVLNAASGNQAAKQPMAREPAASNTLELVEKEDFEDWLVVRVAVSRADSQVREAMIELQLRIDAAFASKTGHRLFNPFSPAALCHTLSEVIRPLGLKNAVLEVVFRVFQSHILDKLPGIYTELNTLFTEARVLPRLDVNRYLADQARSEATHNELPRQLGPTEIPPDKPQVADQPGTADSSPRVPASAFNVVTRLNSLHRRSDSNSAWYAPADAAAEMPEFDEQSAVLTMLALGNMKARLLNTAAVYRPLSLRQQLLDAAPAGHMMCERELDAVEMIEGLFQSIASSERVADDLQDDLHSLQIPLLRIMLTDPELFNAPAHPARQAMNHLALLVDQDSINLTANRQPIRQSIQQILGSEDDVDGFVQALPALEELVLREQRIIDRNRQRIREKCTGQQRLTQATRRVERELTYMLDRAIPIVILDIVEQGWREYMRLACLRQGADSKEFADTIEALQAILLYLQPERAPDQLPAGSASELIEPVACGLSRVSQGTDSRDALTDSLRVLLDTGITPTTPMAHYTGAELDSEVLEKRLAEQTDTDEHLLRWLKRARALETGQWFEVTSESTPTQLLQLLWVAEDTDQFMFANRQGTRSLALPLDDVARRLRDGSLEPMHEAALPAVDQGLDALIQKMYDKLAFDSSHDQLTGLQTRKEFSRRLAQCVERASQATQTYTLIFIDIQQFKVINNTCGYEAGDRFLRELAERLRSIAGTAGNLVTEKEKEKEKETIIGRVGADQFALLLPVPSDSLGYRLAVEIKSAIETNRFVENGQSFVIHAAIAMLGFDHRNKKVMELLRSVETASELSKRAGSKDIQVVLPGDGRLEQLDEVMTWVTRINRALDDDNLKLRCQMIAPLAGAGGQKLPHYEVLLTVIDDQGEHMPPAGFIKAAEDYNRMGSVDRWVIETVLRWMMEHPEQLRLSGGFSINLSGHSMNDETFLDFIFDALVRYQVPRDKLIFEITESTAVANLEDAADFIAEMRSIGCRFSLDDFGVGQSSYSYLKRLPVDFIKIDGTFIRDITSSDVDFALVRSITEMGHYLQKQVVAEHVSNQEILATVTAIGVDYAQGHVHGLPVLLDHLGVPGPHLEP
ncbi:hypothetical protein GCM10007418_26150 [Halopseudomonas salina]|uniref:Diguanylate cyclase/phosphodiesterase n=2 Tax=Halopseudomonas salina TaxID=1323744 RepID=A0ABQ1PX11_9GAMM|nr:hypothetical protein GCM10007418_26150 [Halopseudomonas salina]